MIAAVCAWHEHHDRAAGEINLRLRRGERMQVAGPALVESYAVLTRLPPPHRLPPDDGQAYDAVIAACALKANADVLLTFNEGHFRSLAERGIEIVVPGSAKA